MDFYLQFGWGMKEHCCHLVKKWGNGTVILSPRDIEPSHIISFSNRLNTINGKTLFDPQLYNPRADHHRLIRHDYWPNSYSTGAFTNKGNASSLFKRLKEVNDHANTHSYIIPGTYCKDFDSDWIHVQHTFIDLASEYFEGKDKFATICLSPEIIRSADNIEGLLNLSEKWTCEGFYVVPEHPRDNYLVDDPVWLSNLLILCSGLKLQGKKVIVGYSTHQLLCLSAANVDAISSGNWLNVRSFSTNKFEQPKVEEERRKALWYYCPQSLSEYKLPFLDMGYKANSLEVLKPDSALGSNYADILFSGAQPSLTAFSSRDSFRHYLHCIKSQCALLSRKSYQESLSAQHVFLESAERIISILHSIGVRGQHRDFHDYVDVTRSALSALDNARGFVLSRSWD